MTSLRILYSKKYGRDRMKSDIKRSVLIIIIILCGFAAGVVLSDGGGALTYNDRTMKPSADLLFKEVPLYCGSAFIEASLIFISGFTICPLALSIPIFALRGFALGNAVSYISFSDHTSIVFFISYTLITLIFIPLYLRAEKMRYAEKGKRIKSALSYSLSFLMVSGAAIILKTLPSIIGGRI